VLLLRAFASVGMFTESLPSSGSISHNMVRVAWKRADRDITAIYINWIYCVMTFIYVRSLRNCGAWFRGGQREKFTSQLSDSVQCHNFTEGQSRNRSRELRSTQ
jgi:hypothetical protein